MSKLTAQQFNDHYPIGSYFYYQPNRFLNGGETIRTWGKAKDEGKRTIVEINIEPYYVDIDSLIH
ncbi:hypothetical protein M0K80_RS04585 [Providencia rettgeri]|uniref:hypothetical protein n=1 Tax=Providencia TaxID=586 RepID=UPI001123B999|nr:hypothetical protein [Providencia stuartii]EIL1983446.1 hypothetical protein [Providencia rettgeri]EIU9514240.1 hypothetical protein [Providencia rettgeri]EJD6670146.1 hypothetical protein [Providencia rettgeri]ELR5093761.1 hypothetical protein [Providencia rettgeri]MCK1142194.1 hypothetical protein [Providencia stuartii]